MRWKLKLKQRKLKVICHNYETLNYSIGLIISNNYLFTQFPLSFFNNIFSSTLPNIVLLADAVYHYSAIFSTIYSTISSLQCHLSEIGRELARSFWFCAHCQNDQSAGRVYDIDIPPKEEQSKEGFSRVGDGGCL